VVVKGRRGDPGFVGDLADPGGGVAAGSKETNGGVADTSARVWISLPYRSIDNLKLAAVETAVKPWFGAASDYGCAVAKRANNTDSTAMRVSVRGAVQGVGFRDATLRHARELGAMGWVRNGEDGDVLVHAEGAEAAVEELVAFLSEGPRGARVAGVDVEEVKVEGHEQFAIRGVPAGVFVVQEHAATPHHFDLRLEVEGTMRSWAVPKGPSMDPAVKRLAVQVEDHSLSHNHFEGPTGGGGVIVWDRGSYEQGGRVSWPEALERGHAVFVLHGEKLRGGFALQRTRPGEKPQWLLIKRRDEAAEPGSDVVAERPASVLSGKTLDELL
jgi:DNA ligase D-like protein (predicted 3'-phosphoesterase)